MNLIFICYNIKLIEKKNTHFFLIINSTKHTHTHIYIYIFRTKIVIS